MKFNNLYRRKPNNKKGSGNLDKKLKIAAVVILLFAVIMLVAFNLGWLEVLPTAYIDSNVNNTTYGNTGLTDQLQWTKNVMIWMMLMLVAFLMLFIKKFEWGVCLAVLLSTAGSYIAYLAIQQIFFGAVWNELLLIKAVVCSITVVIAIGVFLGTCKMWQYLLVGILFAPAYALLEWINGGGIMILGSAAVDPGGSILVHMCAAYFGLGVAMAIRDKRAFNEPMYTTTHSVSFVWLASMLLWVLWPAFVTSMLPADTVTWGTITCYLAGIGSIISAYVVCVAIQGKVNPLIYTYAMLAGPVAIGAALLSVGPWGALAIGIFAGAASALCFIYLQPWLCSKIGVLDVMGVHNLHGVGGWIGAIVTCFLVGSVANLGFAVICAVLMLVCGGIVGFIVKLTKGKAEIEICSDAPDFIRNDQPGCEGQ